jgi:hypothetical protein
MEGGNGEYLKEIEEVSFPSLDEALELKFDLNQVTSL